MAVDNIIKLPENVSKQGRKIINIKKVLITIILLLLMFLAIFGGYSLARYIDETQINVITKVAKPVLVLEGEENIGLTAINNNGIYEFSIKNYNNQEQITDVRLKYTIEIISNTDSSIIYELYKNGEKLDLQNNKTSYLILSNKEKQVDNYKLVITYNKNLSDTIGDILQDIQIKVHSEQIS